MVTDMKKRVRLSENIKTRLAGRGHGHGQLYIYIYTFMSVHGSGGCPSGQGAL